MRYLTDHAIATLLWVAAVVLSVLLAFSPWVALGLIAAASVNLLQARFVAWDAGRPLAQRVREVLRDELSTNAARLAEVERGVEDVKQAQISIAGQFRGAGTRNHP